MEPSAIKNIIHHHSNGNVSGFKYYFYIYKKKKYIWRMCMDNNDCLRFFFFLVNEATQPGFDFYEKKSEKKNGNRAFETFLLLEKKKRSFREGKNGGVEGVKGGQRERIRTIKQDPVFPINFF